MQSRELTSVVEEDEFGNQRQSSWQWDLDELCSYPTFKVVRIRDKFLGAIYWGTVTVIVMYIVVVAFHIDQRHQASDPGVGTVLTKFKGKAYAKGNTSKVFDEADLRFPVIEPAGVFIMTKRVVVKNQTLGTCVDYDSPQACPCDNATCSGDYCEVKGWCPSLGEANADEPPDEAEVDEMEGLEGTILEINAGISFPYAGNYLFVASGFEGTPNIYRNITLGALLSQADPPMKVQDLVQKGALIGVSFYWDCDLTSLRTLMGDTSPVIMGLGENTETCPYYVAVSRLDGGQGFAQKRARRYTSGGTQSRDAIYMTGLRILVDSSGVGRRVSLVLIVIQLGSMFSLLRMAASFADFVMLSMTSEERQVAYKRCKVQETEDYSDLQDRIDQVRLQKHDFATSSSPSATGAGTQVTLGLGGAGGRGGSGTAGLRGRGGGLGLGS
mmetsp:Transcript_33628/g.85175  ORF Transcript_33628/g.85175 Transcript_33628/m.85175 type:complete len:441 (-) Transcript_33628:7-1329(-)